ncbi:AraC family transcriptional regulator [Hymenobacter sp. 15J16-1T3B]|uniref:AraC family transcriptional regulator n=1 Tax=Hymenobacter sp. 15J16-1T3B TaxID=2886941 RepID=UPI001D1108BC|nr:AraC family transcriptional regulator [Hymenobacter sp. 15J16-1T3B]MCC3155679.1 AraC family transcriptional regulator [Hymenobacter sp. 15J16-1T3B]
MPAPDDQLRPNGTLSAGSLNLILWAAVRHGADYADLCRRSGVDPAQLQQPDARVPVATVQRLWGEAVHAADNPHLGLLIGEQVNPLALGILSYVLMHTPTLGAALQQLCRYQDIGCDASRTTLRQEGDVAWLEVELLSPAIVHPDHVLNSELTLYLHACRALTGQPLAPRAVHLAYPRPADTAAHQRAFAPAALTFGTPRAGLGFDAAALALPVLNANPALFPLFEQHADALLAQLRQPTLPDRVKREIVRLLKGAEPTLAAVADALAMGVRTLQLHLREAGLSYQQLLDEVRRELAERHLRAPHLSTTDVAFLLGYSEPSVFVRSFKRWTGQTPGAFRKQQAA